MLLSLPLCSKMVRGRRLSIGIATATVGEHEKFKAILARAKDKSHIRLAALHRGIFAAAPPSEIMLKIVAVRLRISEGACNFERSLLQYRGVPIVIVGESATQIDQIVFDESAIGRDSGIV